MFLLENQQTEKDLLVLREKNETASTQLEDTNREYQHTKVEYDRLEQELEELNRQMDELREKTQQNALQKQQLEGQINVLNEQIQAGLQSDTHFKNRLEIVEEDLKQRQQARSEVEEEKGSLHTIVKEAQKRLTDQEDRLHTVQEQISQCESAVEDGKNEIIEILNSRATTKGKAQRFDTLMEQVGIRKAEVNQHILHLKSEEAQQKTIRAKAQSEYDQITEEIHQIDQKSRQMDQQVHSLSEDLKKQTTQLEISQTAYHREASRLESLRNITERYDGYGNSIRRVMEQKDRVSGIRGVVADLIQVNKEYEIAIETALGGSIQNIVTDNEQTAKRMIEYLKKNRFGRATFLPLNSINTRGEFSQKDALKEAGVIGLASDLVTTEKEYTGLTRYLLGRVLVVDQIDHAIAIAKKYHHSLRMVTIEGESLSPGGSMTGGAFKNNSNLLGRRREIEELEGKVAAQKEEVNRLAASMEENRHNRNQLREQISQLQEQLRSKYVAQNTAKMNLVQLNDKEQEIRDGYERIRLDQEQIRRQISEIKQDHDKIDEELKASRQDEKELETYIETRQKELEEWKNEESSVQRKLEDLRLEASTTQQKESFASENLSRLVSEIQGLVQEKQTILETLKQGNQEMENKRRSVEELKEAVSGFGGQEEADRQQLENWQKEKDLKNTSHKAFFEKRDHLSGQISLLDKECFRLKSQMEKLEESREAQISYMWEEYEITPNNALQYRKEEYTDLKEMKKQITQLKDEIRKLGSVNVNAIEDYKNLQERHAFLSGQYEDLKKAEAQLENIIRELDEGMRQQFSEKFRDIQREFDKAFKELFGGGKGTLELEEDVDILEAGIKIISQPPGKKLQNMMQLSGGEKALTAIALLFAIQNLKPSPFCLLDEIEAALDDSNVGRFAGYLQKLTKNTQFIIITHRRGTMNAADRLYGITMQEKGVSTLVSVDLVENQLTQ